MTPENLARVGPRLPAGRAVAVSDEDPDLVLYATRNRLYLSRDGGRFWHGLAVELPEIESPQSLRPTVSETLRSQPELTSRDDHGRSTYLDSLDALGAAVHARIEGRRSADLDALGDLDLLAEWNPAVPREMERERAGRRAGRRVLATSPAGMNIRVFHVVPSRRSC
jgi:phage tail protein X